jgi:hypothetical protein
VTGRGAVRFAPQSHFDIGLRKGAYLPFHLWLALPDAKSAGPDWNAQHRGGLVAAALLEAVRIPKLIDVDAGVKRLYRYDKVHVLKPARQFATQIDKPITGLAR